MSPGMLFRLKNSLCAFFYKINTGNPYGCLVQHAQTNNKKPLRPKAKGFTWIGITTGLDRPLLLRRERVFQTKDRLFKQT
jgi:hypothetical protein